MKITRIEINKIFNKFNYKIPIDTTNNVTIIIGPNGSGKTIILKMINAISENDFSIFYEVPFKNFNIFFDDNTNISINKSGKKNSININFFNNNKLVDTYSIAPQFTRDNKQLWRKKISFFDQEDEMSYFKSPIYNADNLFEYKMWSSKSTKKAEPSWYKKVKAAIKTILVGTERLYRNKNIGNTKNDLNSSVLIYSNELANTIQKKLSEFSSISMTLDKTFPSRLIQQQLEYKVSEKQLNHQLLKLENKRKRLKDAGLFYDNDDTNFNLFLRGNANEKSILTEVLAIYFDDTNKKLSIFDSLLSKIELFKNFIDKLFLYKKITFNKDKGFIFQSLDGDYIPLESLSSGEQHEIVLLYELIFKIEENALLLIDEPEISLHLFWQQQFLNHILDICKLSNVKAIIATHSSSIINNNWELTIDLEDQQYEKIY